MNIPKHQLEERRIQDPKFYKPSGKCLANYLFQKHIGNGSLGWPEKKEFTATVLTAASKQIPDFLLKQLKNGGRMILPLELGGMQRLCLVNKSSIGEISYEPLLPVRFVPLLF